MAEARRVNVGREEAMLFRQGYRLYRERYGQILAYVRQNANRLPEDVRQLYQRRTNRQLTRRIREYISREIAE